MIMSGLELQEEPENRKHNNYIFIVGSETYMEDSNVIKLPIYQRLLGFISVAPVVLWRLLEADLRYRLEHEPMRRQALAVVAPYFRRYLLNGIESLLVDIETYGEHALGGFGLSDLEDSKVREDVRVFHSYLESRLRTSNLDFYARDAEAPENKMVILTDEEQKPIIGVRLPNCTPRASQ